MLTTTALARVPFVYASPIRRPRWVAAPRRVYTPSRDLPSLDVPKEPHSWCYILDLSRGWLLVPLDDWPPDPEADALPPDVFHVVVDALASALVADYHGPRRGH